VIRGELSEQWQELVFLKNKKAPIIEKPEKKGNALIKVKFLSFDPFGVSRDELSEQWQKLVYLKN
jgi:hypothetical protein